MVASTHEPEVDHIATADDTVDDIVRISIRKDFPLRRTFLQLKNEEGKSGPGPLAQFVRSGDHRALVLYLMLITKASSEPWDASLPAAAWARALGIELPTTKSASSAVSKTWMRLERRNLIARERSARRARITLLQEDGSGLPYSLPASVKERYLRIPTALWTAGPQSGQRWYRLLNLSELALLLIARSQTDNFTLPLERFDEWYGISADTAARGLHGLECHGLLTIKKNVKKAPLSATGFTEENVYGLSQPFGPMAISSRNYRRTTKQRKS
jgi:hypothetical protein